MLKEVGGVFRELKGQGCGCYKRNRGAVFLVFGSSLIYRRPPKNSPPKSRISARAKNLLGWQKRDGLQIYLIGALDTAYKIFEKKGVIE